MGAIMLEMKCRGTVLNLAIEKKHLLSWGDVQWHVLRPSVALHARVGSTL